MPLLRSATTCAVLASAAVLSAASAAHAAPSEVHLRAGAAAAEAAVTTYAYGVFGDQHLLCDWNGDGRDTLAVYRSSQATWHLRQTQGGGNADLTFRFGTPGAGDRVLCGDWDGDGDDTPGLFRSSDSTWHFRDSNTAGPADRSFRYGRPGVGDTPLAGDWDGDGDDTPGIFRVSDNLWYLRNASTAGVADTTFRYGRPGNADTPVTGDWNGDDRDTVGIFRSPDRTLHLRDSNTSGPSDYSFPYGRPTDRPLAGDWDADGRDEPAVSRQTPPPVGTACSATAVRFSYDDSALCLVQAVAEGDRAEALNYGSQIVVDALFEIRGDTDLTAWVFDGCFTHDAVEATSGWACTYFVPEGLTLVFDMDQALKVEDIGVG